MAKTIATINVNADTFQTWVNKTNEIANTFQFVVTANSTGEITTGKAFVNGSIGSNTVYIGATNTGVVQSATSNQDGLTVKLIDSFVFADARTVKYVFSVGDRNNAQFQSTELLLVHDNTNTFVTEYATLVTNNTLATFAANANATHVRLYSTPAVANTKYNYFKYSIGI
jgi:hypothetical protein